VDAHHEIDLVEPVAVVVMRDGRLVVQDVPDDLD
jgi:hypothetical protein